MRLPLSVDIDAFQPAIRIRRGDGYRDILIGPVLVTLHRAARRRGIPDNKARIGKRNRIVAVRGGILAG
ncbi:hypothetical protein SDC9_165705 [bioreactor metagenome]|uniref:Uncharacterized protein n=1 Tax=bioreactor metagenome TaxID=1076179 RepID=A0A645FV47_9ZZZZ